jgi:sigma-B regulation protein RsbU (phosphoserine phosphatase)
MRTAGQQIEAITTWKRHLRPRTLPHMDDWEWAVYSSENDWPGGDYFDVLPLSKEQWLVFVADASGHGGAAAVLAALARMVLHSCPLTSGQDRGPFCPIHGLTQTPPIILSRLNHVLAENSLDEQFMTAFLGQWKPKSARLDFVVAGHPLPRYWRQASQHVETISGQVGLPLGIFPAEMYHLSHVTFEPGDAIVIFTDGLTEMRNSQNEMFGTACLDTIIQETAIEGAEAVKVGVLAGLTEFAQGNLAQDDVTFLVLKRWD